jgi:hypothetical protein
VAVLEETLSMTTVPFQRDRLAEVQDRVDALAKQFKVDFWGEMATESSEHVDIIVNGLLDYAVRQRRRAANRRKAAYPH